MAQRVLISAPYLIPDIDRFRTIFDANRVGIVVANVQERLSEEALLEYAGKIDGVICGDDQFTERVFEAAAPRLKVVSKWGTGIDSIDVEAASQFDVQVYNVPGAFTDAVADTVMGYVLCFARGLPWMDTATKRGSWEKRIGFSLVERTLGVVGVGRIGKAVLTRAHAFGARLLGNDVVEIDPAFVSSTQVNMVSLDELLEASDYVSVCCDLNSTSRGLINGNRLELIKAGSVLINTARGPIVEEGALVEALRSGRLSGAALDVFEEEPLPDTSPLRGMDNVLLAPHNSNSSPAAWESVHRMAIRNLFAGLGLGEADVEDLKSERAVE